MNISLKWHEVLMAAQIGVVRQVQSLKKGLRDKHGHEGAGWNLHLEGCCGELAVAKALNQFWDGSVNSFKVGGDVGGLHVRTRSKHSYELIVRDDDPDDAAFVLVTGTCPEYRVRGWILGGDAKRSEWRQTHGGREAAWFVPHENLHPIECLKGVMA